MFYLFEKIVLSLWKYCPLNEIFGQFMYLPKISFFVSWFFCFYFAVVVIVVFKKNTACITKNLPGNFLENKFTNNVYVSRRYVLRFLLVLAHVWFLSKYSY